MDWSRDRYEAICAELRPFLVQSGFLPSKTSFVPVAAMQGVNLTSLDEQAGASLREWYSGPTLVDLLGRLHLYHSTIWTLKLLSPDKLDPPIRDISAPLRIPISNVFKRQSSGAAVSGRLCGGVVQVGEVLRVLPGDETAIIKCEILSPSQSTRAT